MDGRLYGGAAIGISVATAEKVSERPAVWMTTQFVSTVARGAEVDVLVEVLAGGRRTAQVRVTATSETGDTVFASLGATGKLRPDYLMGEFERCPTVEGPETSEPWLNSLTALAKAAGLEHIQLPKVENGFGQVIEMRQPAITEHPDPGPGRVCLWVRRKDEAPITRATAAFLADMVPMGIAHALGALVGGTSLDNTIRIGAFTESDWVLLDLRPHFAAGGYGHGVVHVWSEDGRLLASASQTASMILWDADNLPRPIDPPPEG
jgi:acyl-CoA thioesterase